jgi:hypothetical protein
VLTELRFIEQDRAEKLKQKSEMDRLINRLKAQATRSLEPGSKNETKLWSL